MQVSISFTILKFSTNGFFYFVSYEIDEDAKVSINWSVRFPYSTCEYQMDDLPGYTIQPIVDDDDDGNNDDGGNSGYIPQGGAHPEN